MQHLIDHANQYFADVGGPDRLLSVWCGNIEPVVLDSIAREILHPKALKSMEERLVTVNILQMANDRVSRVYADQVERITDPKDQPFIDYIQSAGLNDLMSHANRIYNLHGYCCLEPFIRDGQIQLRVLDATSVTPFSDDPKDPATPTHFIKWLDTQKTDNGSQRIYEIYDAESITRVTDKGEIISQESHTLGRIPLVYLTRNPYSLKPVVDNSGLRLSLSISKKLTDLSYASLFQSHGIMYGVDIDFSGPEDQNGQPQNMEANPDSFLSLRSLDGHGQSTSPQVGVLQPSVNIAGTLALIAEELSIYLRSIGVTSAQAIGDSPASAASGIAKTIDDSDASKIIKDQQFYFRRIEQRELWPLLAAFHTQSGAVSSYPKGLPQDFEVSVSFPEKKASESHTAIVQRLGLMLDAGLTSKRRAVGAANPDLTDEQITELIKEIEAERAPAESHIEDPQRSEPQPEGSGS